MTTNPLDTLRARGFVADVTDEAGLRELLGTQRVTFYVGFDPTAASLHAGSLVGMMAMSHLQRAGHRAIALAGGATGRIGDPTGRDAEREVMTEERLATNLAGIRRDLGRVLDLDDPERGILVDNNDWTAPVTFLEWLREVGVHFSVNGMLAKESVRKRLEQREQGLTFTEFSYQLLQANDFAHLYDTEGCLLQGGGTDQWGNITAGIDLVRRKHGVQAYGLTWPLLLTSDGVKFGKSAGNAVWLDPDMTTAFAYYQWWLKADDRDVVRFLKLFTYLDLDEIDDLARQHEADPSARHAHRVLAREATRVIHGDQGVEAAERATAVLFGDEPFADMDDRVLADAFAEAPTIELDRTRLEEGIGLLDVMSTATDSATPFQLATSNSDARRKVEQGSVRLNNEKVADPKRRLGPDDLASDTTMVLSVGKKTHLLVRFT